MAWTDQLAAFGGPGFDIDPITGKPVLRSPTGQSVYSLPAMPVRPPGFVPPPMPGVPKQMLFPNGPPLLWNAAPPPPDYPTEAPKFPPMPQGAQFAPLGGDLPGVGASSFGPPPPPDIQGPPSGPSTAAPVSGPPSATPGAGGSSYADRIIQRESGGQADARNPLSSAYGPGQFIDGTWLAFAQANPEPFRGKTREEILAMRSDPALSRQAVDWYASVNAPILKAAGIEPTEANLAVAHAGPENAIALLKADPSAPAASVLSPAVIKANPTWANMTAGQLVAALSAPPSGAAAGSVGAPPEAPVPQPPPGRDLPGVGANANGLASSTAGLRPTQGDKLIALASGLLAGPNFGQGLSKGLTALTKLNADDREAVMRANVLDNQTAKINSQIANTNNQMTNRDRAASWRELSGTQRLALAQQAQVLRARGQEAAAKKIEDQISGGAPIRRENVKAATEYGQAAESALRIRDASQDLVNLIDSGSVSPSGPALEDKLKRFLTNISGGRLDNETQSASGQALFEKLAQQLGNAGALAAAGGRLPRANAEFQQFLRGSANGSMNIDALKALAQKMASESGAIVEGYNQFNADPDVQTRALSGLGGVRSYQNHVLENFYAQSSHFSRPETPTPGGHPGPFVYTPPGGGPKITIQ